MAANRRESRLAEHEQDIHPMQAWSMNELQRASAYVKKYESLQPPKCKWEDLVVHLSDEPRSEKGWTCWSARSKCVPTLRRSGGLLACPSAARHLTMRELFLAMGFPTYQFAAEAAGVSTYNLWRNFMHCAQVGCFTACLLACSRYRGCCRKA